MSTENFNCPLKISEHPAWKLRMLHTNEDRDAGQFVLKSCIIDLSFDPTRFAVVHVAEHDSSVSAHKW